jgi:hypothetical protein
VKIAVKPGPLQLTLIVDATIRKQPLLVGVDETQTTAVVTLVND